MPLHLPETLAIKVLYLRSRIPSAWYKRVACGYILGLATPARLYSVNSFLEKLFFPDDIRVRL
jgi:hypothetical protein